MTVFLQRKAEIKPCHYNINAWLCLVHWKKYFKNSMRCTFAQKLLKVCGFSVFSLFFFFSLSLQNWNTGLHYPGLSSHPLNLINIYSTSFELKKRRRMKSILSLPDGRRHLHWWRVHLILVTRPHRRDFGQVIRLVSLETKYTEAGGGVGVGGRWVGRIS